MAEARNNANSSTKDNTDEAIFPRLHLAAMKGDWKFTQKSPYLQNISGQITKNKETSLHIAAIAKQVGFAKKLVKGQNIEYLTTRNHKEHTAISYAATTGNVKLTKVMVEKLKQGSQENLVYTELVQPLIIAAELGHRKMVDYLLSECELDQCPIDKQFELFVACIETSLYDVAASLLHKNTGLAKYNDKTALRVLAHKPSACDGTNPCNNLVKELCKHAFSAASIDVENPCSSATNDATYVENPCISASSAAFNAIGVENPCSSATNGATYVENPCSSASSTTSNGTDVENPCSSASSAAPMPQPPPKDILSLLFTAAEVGNLEVLIELIRLDPSLIWTLDNERGTIFHIAVRQRHESIFGLLSELGSTKYLITQCLVKGGNNILHLAAESAPQEKVNVVSGAALQMQRELVWYMEAEKIVPHSYKRMENSSERTPQVLFEEKHEKLRMEGEKWMKDTATSSMVVATLITTVMFGAAFNVPGGFNSSGEPNHLKKKLFSIFFISDALALFSSSTSALMFLLILTSRYAYSDFLRKLPIKLMIGVTSLFISMAAMMVAFCATFLLYYQHTRGFTLILTIFGVYACVPILYFSMKYSLLVDLIRAIFYPRSLFQPPKRLLY